MARALERAYDEVQRQLPRSAARLRPEEVERLVEDSIGFAAEMSLMNLDLQRSAALEHDRDLGRYVSDEVRRLWGAALDELRLLRWVAFEEARDFHAAVPDAGALRQALVRLHARAVTVSDEILCLLDAGYASGALARWRTLHEMAVTATVLGQHGEPIAERYLAHGAVTRYKHSLEYQANAHASGQQPLSPAQLEANKRARDAVVAKFGTPFKDDYGWAAASLNAKRVTFRDLEQAARRGYLRPYYQYASGRVHAGAHGLHDEVADGDELALITGAYPARLTDPLQLTALSLRGTTGELLMASTSGSGVRERIVLEILERLYERIGDALPETATNDTAEEPVLLAHEPTERRERPLAAWPPLSPDDADEILRDAAARTGVARRLRRRAAAKAEAAARH